MLTPFDTIVAEVTPPGIGGLAVVRVSGPDAWAIARTVLSGWPDRPSTHRAVYGTFVHGDDGLALPFGEGHGYTGDVAVEFSIHGSPASVSALISSCLAGGARRATPGEFTLRAFLNGRLDLSQAEGVLATVESETAAQLSAANALRGGSLSSAISVVRTKLIEALMEIEARVDFSEEVGPLDTNAVIASLEESGDRLRALEAGAAGSRIVRRGLRVAIVGPPNAGKSSLMNALLNTERAIVTPIPGTTRDVIEERLDVRGFPVVLIDTAGLRDSSDPIEALGIQRTRLAAAEADAVWYVFDATVGPTEADEAFIAEAGAPVLTIANKCDLLREASSPPVAARTQAEGESPNSYKAPHFPTIADSLRASDTTPQARDEPGTHGWDARATAKSSATDSPIPLLSHPPTPVSAVAREGLGALTDWLVAQFDRTRLATPVNERHADLLAKAIEAVDEAIGTLASRLPEDLASVVIGDALDHLGRITGETASPDLLHDIFARFCIGK